MQFNLFDWVREGVKRSVILGVHDAVEAIGSPVDDDARTQLAALLPPVEGTAGAPALSAGGKRKRLGRSLREFDGTGES
jgi:hypothetical protein